MSRHSGMRREPGVIYTFTRSERRLLDKFMKDFKSPLQLLLSATESEAGNGRRLYAYAVGKIGMSKEDIEQACYVGVIRSLSKFDPSRGYKFATYARLWVVSTVQDLVQKESKNRVRHVQIVRQKYHDLDLQQSLTDPEDPRTSQDRTSTEEMREHVREIVQDALNNLYHPKFKTLSLSRIKAVIEYRYGLNGKEQLKLSDVGKLFNISKERVRQLQLKGMILIRKHLEKKGICELPTY